MFIASPPPALQQASFGGRPQRAAAAHAGQITLIYLAIAGLWIALSDRLLWLFAPDAASLARIGTFKGWVFVALTAGGLFWLLKSKLRQQESYDEKLRSLVEHAPVALAMLDRELRFIVTSRRWRQDFALGEREIAGARHDSVFSNVPARWREIHERALRGESSQSDLELIDCAGGGVWLRREVRPWMNAAGEIQGIVIFAENVTAGKKAEEAVSEWRSRLQMALAAGRVSTWTWTIAQDRIDCDEGAQRLFGWTREEIGRSGLEGFKRCVHPEDRTRITDLVRQAMETGTEVNAEYRILRPDGNVAWILCRGVVERDESGQAARIIGACVDVTEGRRMQEALAESERRFREMVETISEVFWISDAATQRIVYVSPAYAGIWGRPCEALAEAESSWLDGTHPDDRERVMHAVTTKQAEGTYDETYRVVRPDGAIRWVRDVAFPVRDADGRLLRIIGCARDITGRKSLEEQFLRAQRLEAIGTLASGVAHDLNNILAPMFMVGPLLREKLPEAADRDMLMLVEKSAQRGADVVRQLLTFGRGVAGERGLLQVRHLVREMTSIMNETFPREIGIVHQVPADLWPVVGDATQLHQVLMNLCVNARDAMPGGGRLSIDAKNAEIGAAGVQGHDGVEPGRFVVVTVADTGQGIPREIRAKIFEPFFTTKPLGKGTGLGLSTVIGIVQSHGGFVTLESEVGRGTKFRVHLPCATVSEELPPPPRPTESAPGRGELVLIVDDDGNVRQAMQRVLEHNGYRVLTAANGREGLGLFLLQREKVKLLVTDIMMPEMDGNALVRAVHDLDKDLPILAATGLISGDKRDAMEVLGARELLPKPYTSFELLDAVARQLATRVEAASAGAAA